MHGAQRYSRFIFSLLAARFRRESSLARVLSAFAENSMRDIQEAASRSRLQQTGRIPSLPLDHSNPPTAERTSLPRLKEAGAVSRRRRAAAGATTGSSGLARDQNQRRHNDPPPRLGRWSAWPLVDFEGRGLGRRPRQEASCITCNRHQGLQREAYSESSHNHRHIRYEIEQRPRSETSGAGFVFFTSF